MSAEPNAFDGREPLDARQLEALLNASPDWFTIVGSDGLIRWVSDGYERSMGFPASSRIGQRPTSLIVEGESDSTVARFLEQSKQRPDRRVVLHVRIVDAWDRIRDIEATVIDIRDQADAGVLIASRDVTEQLAAERELTRQREAEQAVHELTRQLNELTVQNFEAGMRDVLRKAGERAGAERAFVMVAEADGSWRHTPYEWRKDGIEGMPVLPRRSWLDQFDHWFTAGDPFTVDLRRLARRVPGLDEAIALGDCTWAVIAPAMWADGLRGIIGLAAVDPGWIDGEHDTFVRGLAQAIGSAVLRHTSDEFIRTQERELAGRQDAQQIIAAVSTAFVNNATEQLDDTILDALDRLREFLDVPRAAIFRVPDGSDSLAVSHERVESGLPTISEALPMHSLEDVIAASPAFASGQVVVAHADDEDRRLIDLMEIDAEPRLFTLLCAPIIVSGDLIGMLTFSLPTKREFDEAKLRLIRTFTEMFGATMARRAVEQRLAAAALHDPLTGLANRLLLNDRLAKALARCERTGNPLCVVFIDCDNFKVINDTLGHDSGDVLISTIANRLLENCRPEDTVARFGGDEFVVVSEVTGGDASAVEFANRLLHAIREPLVVAGRQMDVSASVGMVIRTVEPGDPLDGSAFLRMADIAMYRAKHLGKNRIELFTDDMEVRTRHRFDLQAGLRRAIDSDQLVISYQPIFATTSQEIVSMEALLRWDHPERGVLMPGAFIDVAEESGLIRPIGAWVLHQAIVDFAAIVRKGLVGPSASVSVNLSVRQLSDAGFVRSIAAELQDAGLPPSRLQLELTEGILADRLFALPQLLAIHELGVRIAIDDFGTGYSSLAYLRDLPAEMLKIDRSFVQGIAVDRRDEALVRSIITIAHDLGLGVTAEGVETAPQLRLLAQLGCDHVQGYLLARPVPLMELWQLLGARPSVPMHH